MGISISLPWASLVITWSLAYNPNTLIQCMGRALRLSQPRKVLIYVLFWNETEGYYVEQKILKMQSHKM